MPSLRASAVIFDLDGTLVDSEEQTDATIAAVMAARGVAGARLPPSETRGRTWGDIVASLRGRYSVNAEGLEDALLAHWAASIDVVTPIAGAPRALAEASRHLKIAVCSSSPRAIIDRFLDALGAATFVPPHARIGAGDAAAPKPAPDGFLLAAERLGVAPASCVVFEDSTAGLRAARAAGMASVAVLDRCAEPAACTELATASCQHYDALPASFWQRLPGGLRIEAPWI